MTATTGVPRSCSAPIQSASRETSASQKTTIATSVFSSASRVRRTRSAPSSPSSSKPAVSISMQGPMPWISIAL